MATGDGCTSSSPPEQLHDLADRAVRRESTPVIVASWDTIMITATPAMYPIRTGNDSRSATNPSRSDEGGDAD